MSVKTRSNATRVSIDMCERAIFRNAGLVTKAAKSLRMTNQGLRYRINNSKRLQQTLHNAREANLDLAESTIYKLIREGNLQASVFYLKNIGRCRGYTQNRYMDDDDVEPDKITIKVTDGKSHKKGEENEKH